MVLCFLITARVFFLNKRKNHIVLPDGLERCRGLLPGRARPEEDLWAQETITSHRDGVSVRKMPGAGVSPAWSPGRVDVPDVPTPK